jgi:glutamate-1-semialdehyde 2,1-aminomutase
VNVGESERLWEEAKKLIPGGVNSPVRSFGSVGGVPRFINRGEGPYLWDVDGNRYVDYVLSWGPLILGHAHPLVVRAVQEAAERGTSYGAPTALEVRLAELIVQSLPSVEMVRLVSSGTEATMSAVRLARAYTRRNKVIKFAGTYHGHGDTFLVKAGSGATTLGFPDSPGVPEAATSETLIASFNDLATLRALFEAWPDDVAAVITEPLIANMGFIRPEPGFLVGVQDLCREFGALLILDEVITGFRVGLGGAQGLWGLDPDLTCLGKVIGGGLPVGAYGGKRQIMEMMAPSGPVYQAGTLSGNPLATTAGIATLEALQREGVFYSITERTAGLAEGIVQRAERHGIPLQVDSEGTVLGFYFLKTPGARINDYASAKQHADTERYSRFFHAMLEEGFYFAPSQFEVAFASTEHTDVIVYSTLEAFDRVFGLL